MEHIFGQDRILRGLKNAIKTQRLHSGLLFLGPDHVGRETTALWLARALLCENPHQNEGCQTCRSCNRVTSGNHPDLHLVLSEAEAIERGVATGQSGKNPSRAILVEAVRNLNQRLLMRPYEGKASVAIIPRAHDMHPSAANAFLKTLEEPPEDTYIILLAPHARAVLDTIASRCMSIQFAPLSEESREKIRKQRATNGAGGLHDASKDSSFPTSGHEDEQDAQMNELVQQALTVIAHPGTGAFLEVVESVGKDRQQAIRFLQTLVNTAGTQLRQEILNRAEKEIANTNHLPRNTLTRIMEQGFAGLGALQSNGQVQVTLEEFFVQASI